VKWSLSSFSSSNSSFSVSFGGIPYCCCKDCCSCLTFSGFSLATVSMMWRLISSFVCVFCNVCFSSGFNVTGAVLLCLVYVVRVLNCLGELEVGFGFGWVGESGVLGLVTGLLSCFFVAHFVVFCVQ
jgi:hypothetical protein